MPRFVASAHTTWRVVAINDRRAEVRFTATVRMRGIAAPFMAVAMRLQMGRAGVQALSDLRHYVEYGEPSPRKQRQLDRAAVIPRRAARSGRAACCRRSRRHASSQRRARVWEIISDVAGLAAHAPNLSASGVLEGNGDGMVRRCYNNAGDGRNETCTLWEPGHRYTMEVDTSDYPYPLRSMGGTWAVEDHPRGTLIHLRYEYEPKYGMAGRVLSVLMRPVFGRTCRKMLDSYVAALGPRSTSAAREPA